MEPLAGLEKPTEDSAEEDAADYDKYALLRSQLPRGAQKRSTGHHPDQNRRGRGARGGRELPGEALLVYNGRDRRKQTRRDRRRPRRQVQDRGPTRTIPSRLGSEPVLFTKWADYESAVAAGEEAVGMKNRCQRGGLEAVGVAPSERSGCRTRRGNPRAGAPSCTGRRGTRRTTGRIWPFWRNSTGPSTSDSPEKTFLRATTHSSTLIFSSYLHFRLRCRYEHCQKAQRLDGCFAGTDPSVA